MVMAEAYPKDMSRSNWAEVFARQALRAELMPEWFDAIGVKEGDRVLEVGAGPGHVSLALAERVGPLGMVVAIDRSADALAYLADLQRQRGIAQITRIAGDAATVELTGPPADAALVTYVLHHAALPEAILAHLHGLLRPGARTLVGEFHPEGPCEIGVKKEHRIAPERIEAWCDAAGFACLEYRRQTPEHYMLLVERV
jgi:ubiquinone/menaquinone biosynthesis C-methylase UbiE